MPTPRTSETSLIRSLYQMECEIAELDTAKQKKQAAIKDKVAQLAKLHGATTAPAISAKPAANSNGTKKAHKAPKVRVLYRNPQKPEETWSGRGRPARWLTAVMQETGKPMAAFRV